MTGQQNVAALAKAGQTFPIKPVENYTRELKAIAETFERKRRTRFKPLKNVDKMDPATLKATPTHGRVFDGFVAKLNALGIPTRSTVGSVMENLDLTQGEVHNLACYCLGEEVTGHDMADRVRRLIVARGTRAARR